MREMQHEPRTFLSFLGARAWFRLEPSPQCRRATSCFFSLQWVVPLHSTVHPPLLERFAFSTVALSFLPHLYHDGLPLLCRQASQLAQLTLRPGA